MSSGPNDLELRRRQLRPQQSTLYTRQQQAVCVRHAYKSYGSKKDPCVVLDGLNMTVPKGVIYGLLGASGCGKTTLLNCIVGRKVLHSGEIWVLGGTPRSKGSGIPGPRLGYMPQELALYGEFTIFETLRFFGWVTRMTSERIEEQVEFLIKLLMLPDGNQKVKELSVGQQRRVSLASALIHEPELLILDEPTVGVDSLLRQIIWDHFVNITANGHTTIIITTHYIDETRQANLIGLMRAGHLLAEESPTSLLSRMGVETLEEVFLQLSVIQNMGRHRRSSISEEIVTAVAIPSGIVNQAVVLDDVEAGAEEISGEFGDNVSVRSRRGSVITRNNDAFVPLPEIPKQEGGPAHFTDYLVVFRRNNMKALIWKNFLWMIRNISVMMLVIALPCLQIAIFCVCIGHDPANLPIGVVNLENQNNSTCGILKCNASQLACNYIEYLDGGAFTLIPYNSEQAATADVLAGKIYGSVIIKNNYSEALQVRLAERDEAPKWAMDLSTIDVIKDSTSVQISTYMKVYLLKQFQQFIGDYLASCNIDKRTLSVPIRIGTPVYGENIPNFTDFITPGIVLAVTFSLGVALTGTSMMIERSEGSLERYLVMGITEIEILTAHVVCEFIILALQLALTLICTFAIFHMTIRGSLLLATLLILMCGLAGMAFGFTLSSVCKDERNAQLAAMGSLAPLLILCGIIWPVEGMHPVLKPVINYFPLTKTTEALRSVLERGWDLSMDAVYLGFASAVIWTLIFLTISILSLKFRKE